jgi:GT2 family glycosyltransferase
MRDNLSVNRIDRGHFQSEPESHGAVLSVPFSGPSLGIVIATRHRHEPLRECLASIDAQTSHPAEVVVVDSSLDSHTKDLLDRLRDGAPCRYEYRHSSIASAAQQRNLGASILSTDLILFLDDDVVLEPGFIKEILCVFHSHDDRVAGVSGTITNQVYSDPHGLNRLLLGACLGRFRGSFAGRVIGPAVNFLPADGPNTVQQTDWLPTTCTAYRREVFLAHRFDETFVGYSFAEDVHLSTRIARTHRLVNTTRARVFHADLGKDTHRDWAALGESQVVNRCLIMTSVLGRNRLIDHSRLFAYEIFYTALAFLAAGRDSERLSRLARLLAGKVKGFRSVWFRKQTAVPRPSR